MSDIRKKQVSDALAINSLGSVPVDSEMMALLDAYANDEIDYEELDKKVSDKVQADIANSKSNGQNITVEEYNKCQEELMELINKTLNENSND